jgi:Tfp pilus assembly protein PilN
MKALALDLCDGSGRRTALPMLMLVAAAVAAFFVVSARDDLQDEAARLAAERESLQRAVRGLAATDTRLDEATLKRIAVANVVIDQLALPWDRLLAAVEGAAIDAVVLTGIAPDAASGSVQISGDAASESAMIDYLRRLQQQPALSGVYLLNHRHEPRNGARAYRFTVAAAWLPAASAQ